MVDYLTQVKTHVKAHPVAESLSHTHIAEVLKHLHHYTHDTFVIKIDDFVFDDPEILQAFAQDIVLMKQLDIHVILVHGCHHKMLESYASKLGVDTSFIDGTRVMDHQSLEIAEMIMSNTSRKMISAINSAGGMAISVSGRDNALLEARRLKPTRRTVSDKVEKIVDYGCVGEPIIINPDILLISEDTEVIPVVSSIGVGEHGESYYITPTVVASCFASNLIASKLIFMSNESLTVNDEDGKLIETMDMEGIKEALLSQTFSKGLKAKIQGAILAVGAHTEAVHILDAKTPHILLTELFSDSKSTTTIEGEPLFFDEY